MKGKGFEHQGEKSPYLDTFIRSQPLTRFSTAKQYPLPFTTPLYILIMHQNSIRDFFDNKNIAKLRNLRTKMQAFRIQGKYNWSQQFQPQQHLSLSFTVLRPLISISLICKLQKTNCNTQNFPRWNKHGYILGEKIFCPQKIPDLNILKGLLIKNNSFPHPRKQLSFHVIFGTPIMCQIFC